MPSSQRSVRPASGLRFATLSPSEGELAIVEEIANALTELGAKYVLPFCFKNAYGTRTSHHLIFATKNFRGYDIMKGIMGRQSSAADQGVPSCISISLRWVAGKNGDHVELRMNTILPATPGTPSWHRRAFRRGT